MTSPELQRFCDEWLAKAEQYADASVHDCYDKFFTLFVVFNRLYAEGTFELARRRQVALQPHRALPDRKGATEHTLMILGLPRFEELYRTRLEPEVSTIANLIDRERFYIKLSLPDGDRQREKDLALLAGLRSTGKTRALAILDVVYSVRCNMFHGHKGFHRVQVELLQPTIRVLYQVTQALRPALTEYSRGP